MKGLQDVSDAPHKEIPKTETNGGLRKLKRV